MKDKKTTLIIGGIVVLITILLFLIGINNRKEAIDYVAFLFTIISECLFFGTIILYTQQTTISSLAIISVTSVYLGISVLFSLIFKNFFVNNILAFVIIHLVLIGVASMILILLNRILKDVNKDEEETITQMAVIGECERLASILAQSEKFKGHRGILEKIYDEIKYSDHVSDYKSGEILTVLNSIYDSEKKAEINTLCEKALQLVIERNVAVKQLKRGGF